MSSCMLMGIPRPVAVAAVVADLETEYPYLDIH
jgi:hypothetical protein